jgi:phosphodiester glycosidase
VHSPGRWISAAVVCFVALACLAAPAGAELPLGPDSLSERRTTVQVAPGVLWTRIVRTGRADGPFRVHVLAIDRGLPTGRVGAMLANDRVPELERVSSMARRGRAIAGVNGGYFAPRLPDRGDPVGVLAVDGRLVSEPVGARTALLVPSAPDEPIRVAALRWRGSVSLGGRGRLLDGVDRLRGRIPGCGGVGGDFPTQSINPFLVCTDSSELVVFSPSFGSRTRSSSAGQEAVVRDGVVTSLRQGGNSSIPRDGFVLSGTGDAATFLRDRARPGARPQVNFTLRDGARSLDPGDYESISGGAPRLVRAGRIDITPGLEGRARLDVGRSPRTVAGVRADGVLLLMTIDGRRPGWSAGATLREAARTILALGAREAVNFDSGGSTTMVVGSRVVNRPSDPTGERPVSDGLFVLP